VPIHDGMRRKSLFSRNGNAIQLPRQFQCAKASSAHGSKTFKSFSGAGPPKKAKVCNQARQLISPFQFVEFQVSD
jgi:hypothetical protein